MDIITHTILAVGSLVCFFFAGHYLGGKKVAENLAENMVDATITMLEKDGLIRIETDKDGEKEIVPISEIISDTLRNAKV
tara:strand:+ start:426 stop:665 length:240 start_codon:yes stop_codon:yes gene_type:complete